MKTTAFVGALILAALLSFPADSHADSGDPQSSFDAGAARHTTFLPLTCRQQPPGQGSGKAYWGVAMNEVPWAMNKLANWENAVGKQVSIIHYWQFWNQNGTLQKFNTGPANNVRIHGAIPMISWPPMKMGGPAAQPDFQLADVINGSYDGYVRQWATDAKAWGSPFFLRLAHEMNGYWFPWSETANGNSRGQFVQAWRHIHDIFAAAGAKNVTWVWCPNIEFNASSGWPSLASLYPGDAYVDWTCLDGYNWGPDYPVKGGWISFKNLYSYSYNMLLQVAPSKPIMIGEFASTEAGGSKADWIADALGTQIPKTFPRVRAHIWYNWQFDNVDWRIESSQSALNAWKAGISSSHYVPAQVGAYKTSPIPAP